MTKLYRVLGMVCLACGVIACFLLFKTQPLQGFLFGILGIALGLALYEIGELRDRLHHVEENLPASMEKDTVKAQEEPATKTMAPMNRE